MISCSYGCLEGAHTRLDCFEDWTARFLHGRLKGYLASTSSGSDTHYGLYSHRCGCQWHHYHGLLCQLAQVSKLGIVVRFQLINLSAFRVKNGGRPAELQIYHLTSSTYKPFRFEFLTDKINGYLHEYPLNNAVWYPNLRLVKSLFLFRLGAILFHFIPGFFLDLVTKLYGGRPMCV